MNDLSRPDPRTGRGSPKSRQRTAALTGFARSRATYKPNETDDLDIVRIARCELAYMYIDLFVILCGLQGNLACDSVSL